MQTDLEKEFKEFLRTICLLSATMASLSFVGVSIFASMQLSAGTAEWKNVAYIGVVAAFSFAVLSILSIIDLDPMRKRSFTIEDMKWIRTKTWILLLIGWMSFLLLIGGLLITFLLP
jgi:hypothetical protein